MKTFNSSNTFNNTNPNNNRNKNTNLILILVLISFSLFNVNNSSKFNLLKKNDLLNTLNTNTNINLFETNNNNNNKLKPNPNINLAQVKMKVTKKANNNNNKSNNNSKNKNENAENKNALKENTCNNKGLLIDNLCYCLSSYKGNSCELNKTPGWYDSESICDDINLRSNSLNNLDSHDLEYNPQVDSDLEFAKHTDSIGNKVINQIDNDNNEDKDNNSSSNDIYWKDCNKELPLFPTDQNLSMKDFINNNLKVSKYSNKSFVALLLMLSDNNNSNSNTFDKLKQMFAFRNNQFSNSSNNNGVFYVKFYLQGSLKIVSVDSYVPVYKVKDNIDTDKDTKEVPVFTYADNCKFINILEKAYAKLYQNYSNILDKNYNDILFDFVGVNPSQVTINNNQFNGLNSLFKKYNTLLSYLKNNEQEVNEVLITNIITNNNNNNTNNNIIELYIPSYHNNDNNNNNSTNSVIDSNLINKSSELTKQLNNNTINKNRLYINFNDLLTITNNNNKFYYFNNSEILNNQIQHTELTIQDKNTSNNLSNEFKFTVFTNHSSDNTNNTVDIDLKIFNNNFDHYTKNNIINCKAPLLIQKIEIKRKKTSIKYAQTGKRKEIITYESVYTKTKNNNNNNNDINTISNLALKPGEYTATITYTKEEKYARYYTVQLISVKDSVKLFSNKYHLDSNKVNKCKDNCNNKGICNFFSGECTCKNGYTGNACEREVFECKNESSDDVCKEHVNKGMCVNDKDVQKKCKKSCGLCKCNDKVKFCKQYVENGLCFDKNYQDFLVENCSSSCMFC